MLKTTACDAREKFFAVLVYEDPVSDGAGALGVRTPDFDTFGELRMFVGGALSEPTPYSSALLKKYTDLEFTEV